MDCTSYGFTPLAGHFFAFRRRDRRRAERVGGRREFYFFSGTVVSANPRGGSECDQYGCAVAWAGGQHSRVLEATECTASSVGPIARNQHCRRMGGSTAVAENSAAYFSASGPVATAGWDSAVRLRQFDSCRGRQNLA